jgi:PASTA domain
MTSQIAILLAGILLLFIAIAGDCLTVKKIQMRKIPTRERCAVAILGLAFITVSIWGTFKPPSRLVNSDSSSQEYACRHPKDLPAVTEDDRSEAEIRNFLTSEGFLNVATKPTFVPGAPQGAVVGQEPSPGTILCPRDLMIIKIAQ